MSQEERAVVVRVLRRVFTLAGRVRLDIADDGRLLPILAGQDLWRTLPALLKDGALLAEMLQLEGDVAGGAKFVRDLADTIEKGRG